jgi:hypothetical protein
MTDELLPDKNDQGQPQCPQVVEKLTWNIRDIILKIQLTSAMYINRWKSQMATSGALCSGLRRN